MAKTTNSGSRVTIVNKTDMRKIVANLHAKAEEIEKTLIYRLEQIGEACVKVAREDHSNNYNDITGNLRSSIGYVILRNGKPVVNGVPKRFSVAPGYREVTVRRKIKNGIKEYKAKIKVGGDGSAGVKAGVALLNKLKTRYNRGIVLIVCAGMNYAVYVEAIHHKDVLSSAQLNAEDMVKKMIEGSKKT